MTAVHGAMDRRHFLPERPRLSVVIPAYNEEHRLPTTLARVFTYVEGLGLTTEVIVADDGSEDRTAAVVEELSDRLPAADLAQASRAPSVASRHGESPSETGDLRRPPAAGYPGLRVLRLPHAGKAHAVRSAVLAARGHVVFMCDADLSMPIEDLSKLLGALENGADIAVASREAPGAERFDEPAYRHIMGRGFNLAVRALTGVALRDTQCGFKCFRGAVAGDLFEALQLYRVASGALRGPLVTGFDVELLFLAQKRGYRIAEVPIRWYYVSGSKVQPLRDAARMLADVLAVRWHDLRGRYDQPLSLTRPSPGPPR